VVSRRALGLVLGIAVVAAACGGGGKGDSAVGGGPGATAGGGATTTVGTVKPKAGGTLKVGLVRPASLDPAEASATDQNELVAIDLLFDSLTTMAPGAVAASASLAESWTPSPDFKVWTFKLHAGSLFGNGRAVAAADVKYSLERVAKQGAASLTATRLDDITGWQAFVDGTAADLAGIKAVDAGTVEIDLDSPLSVLPELLSNPLFGIVPREAVEAPAPAFNAAPVGSGPFRINSRDADVLHLVRAAPGRALLDGVDLSYYDTVDAAYAAFVAGNLDWAPVPVTKEAEAAGADGVAGFVPFSAELYFAINLVNPKFADVHFRQAIVKAVDRQALANAVYLGRGTVLDGVVPVGVPGHQTDPCGEPCAFDVAGAKALLASAFPAGGVPEVPLDYFSGTTEEAVAGAIQADLAAVGITATKRPHDFNEYQTFVTSGQEELFLLGWVGAYQLPDAYLGPLFSTGSRDNVTGFSDPAVDQLLAAARASGDPTARQAAYMQAETAVLGAGAVVPLIQFQTHAVIASRVRDLTVGVGGTFAGDKVWLADG
jgi:ABC-type transport system substrate-binding protein